MNSTKQQRSAQQPRRRPAITRAKRKVPKDTRPAIIVDVDERRVNDEAVGALVSDPTIFQRGGLLVQVAEDSGGGQKLIWRASGSPKISALKPPVLRERLAAVALWQRQGPKGMVAAHPPAWSVNAVFHRGGWPGIRSLEGIITGPVLRPNGTILASSGYDSATGLLCQMDLALPNIPNAPTGEDIGKAVAQLKDCIADFPFEKPEHQATWVSLLLTLLARPAFPGPSPCFLLDANVRASGKGLLFDLATTIATGLQIPRTPSPTDKEETRKLILSLALEGDPAILLDNVTGNFGNAALEAALTGTRWRDRILGQSQTVTLPLTAVWAATGNNVNVVGDMARRVAHSRLRTMVENPEERADFRHPRLLSWATANRAGLVAAGLTLLRGYWAAGRPDQKLLPWGSYEGWSDLVRSSVVWAGFADPGETRKKSTREDSLLQALTAFLTGLNRLDPNGKGLTASEILQRVTAIEANEAKIAEASQMGTAEMVRDALAVLCELKTSSLPTAQVLGMKLAAFRDRVVGGRYLDSRPRNHTSAWSVAQVGQGGSGT